MAPTLADPPLFRFFPHPLFVSPPLRDYSFQHPAWPDAPFSNPQQRGCTMNRTDRLLGILVELKANNWKRASDLADLFEVSTRTIYRDIQALGQEGIPVVAVPGKGYSFYEGYFLPPLMFSNDEAVMLLLGSEYMARNFDAAYEAPARSGGMKLAAVLPQDLRDTVTNLQERIRFVPVNAFDNPAEQDALSRLRGALTDQQAVRFHYTEHVSSRNGEAPAFTIHPYGLLHQSDTWYLVGLCPDNSRVQHFRLDRMQHLEPLDVTFERPAGYRLDTRPEITQRDLEVKVLFDASVAAWVQEAPMFYVEDMEKHKDGLLVTLKVNREAEVLPWLLGWGAHAYVLAPPSLRRRLAREARAIADRYRDEPSLL